MTLPVLSAEWGALVKRFTGVRILVVGDIMLDVYRIGEVTRFSPEAPVPVLLNPTTEYRLGGAAAVAAMCAELGARVSLAGVIGTDPRGQQIRLLLQMAGISFVGCIASGRVTTMKERIVGVVGGRHRQLICRVDTEDDSPITDPLAKTLASKITNCCRVESSRDRLALACRHADRGVMDADDSNDLLTRHRSRIRQAYRDEYPETVSLGRADRQDAVVSAPDLILVSDYAKGVCVPEIVSAVQGVKIPAIVDPPKHGAWNQYHGWQALVPNRHEANGQTASQIRQSLGLDAAIVKLDEQGCSVSARTSDLACHEDRLIPASRRDVHDVTGAGDQFLAVLGCSRAAGADWFRAAQFANFAAGLQVERFGCVPVTGEELHHEMRRAGRFHGSLNSSSLGGQFVRQAESG